MSKKIMWAIVAMDRYLVRILARKVCLSHAEADGLKAEWEKAYNGYYIVIFKI